MLIDEVERPGGKVVTRVAAVDDLEDLARDHDLVVVSTGRGGLASLFPVDDVAFAVHVAAAGGRAHLPARRDPRPGWAGTALPLRRGGRASASRCPALTVDGPCDIFVVEGVPGGPLDAWDDVTTSDRHLDRLRRLLDEHFPAEASRVREASLVDDRSVLHGSITPVVRRPVGVLPSGATVLGMADVVVLNDPLTSQGSNNATKSASFYLEAINAHEGDFDADWMQRTFDNFWRGWAQWATEWTNAWLRPAAAPPARRHRRSRRAPERRRSRSRPASTTRDCSRPGGSTPTRPRRSSPGRRPPRPPPSTRATCGARWVSTPRASPSSPPPTRPDSPSA